ncbi:Delta-aminolevulinic acid dehydratase [Sporotomaculum syntrophicum]|uniref:Delta-aminolevulinic acid dehydratase n=1 Tax=Sporotomaculum syntrophicum TaxID=182264 RepID=A0A9D2WNU6_9FIRM|nr:porphobilinogen synthase [Sporotomaculum syntrophicum]KAF1084714.1 Delta-aminolevulinic acid dehydratase [Sporotomaculum syntrophicum]
MYFPVARPRRLRSSATMRRLVRENYLRVDDLIYPIFVTCGRDVQEPIESMPGIYRLSIDRLLAEVALVQSLGIPGILLFGIPDSKDAVGSGAYADDGIIQQTVSIVKDKYPDLLVITDVCLCEYTDHGHCGVVQEGKVLNDPTLELLARTAVSHARSGADIIAPSDMMDGRVRAIRESLDSAGFTDTPIMSYSVKYASAFYGPFREAAGSAPQFGDRKSYQMDPPNIREALREVEQDIAEGADMLIVKPAMAYLDVVASVRENFDGPLAVYNVSGEYAMLKAAAQLGWIDERKTTLELLTGMKRAGADIIITYHALDVVRWLNEEV